MTTNFLDKLWESVGLKRRIASLLMLISQVAHAFPELGVVTLWLEQVAAVFGITGVGQAVKDKTVKKHKAATVASILAAFMAAAHYYPQLNPYLGLVRTLAAMFGAVAVTNTKK